MRVPRGIFRNPDVRTETNADAQKGARMPGSVDTALLLRAEEQMNEYDRKAVFWQNFHTRTRVFILVLGVLTALCGVWHTWLPKTDEAWRDWLRYGTIALPVLAAV